MWLMRCSMQLKSFLRDGRGLIGDACVIAVLAQSKRDEEKMRSAFHRTVPGKQRTPARLHLVSFKNK
jgi:hypothetical protein